MSTAVLPGDFREVLQRRLGELESQLLRKVAELEDEKSLLHNETSAHRQKTESALNALLLRVTELERGEFLAGSSVALWLTSLPALHPTALVFGCRVRAAGLQAGPRGWPRSSGLPHLHIRPLGPLREWWLPDPSAC